MKKWLINSKSVKVIGLLTPVFIGLMPAQFALAKWSGVDETVVEHFAEKAGRSAWTPLIDTDQGDILLFVFLLAGVIGGFVIGYYWRVLFGDNTRKPEAGGKELE